MPTTHYTPKRYVSDETKSILFNVFLLVLSGASTGGAIECNNANCLVISGACWGLAITCVLWAVNRIFF